MKPQSQVLNTVCHSFQLMWWKAVVNIPAKKRTPPFKKPSRKQETATEWPQQRGGGPQRPINSSWLLFILCGCSESQQLKPQYCVWQAHRPEVRSLRLAVEVVSVSVPIINTFLSQEAFSFILTELLGHVAAQCSVEMSCPPWRAGSAEDWRRNACWSSLHKGTRGRQGTAGTLHGYAAGGWHSTFYCLSSNLPSATCELCAFTSFLLAVLPHGPSCRLSEITCQV